MEIPERFFVSHIEQVAASPLRHERAVLDLPGVGVFLCFFPAIESLAIHQRDEAFLDFSGDRWPAAE